MDPSPVLKVLPAAIWNHQETLFKVNPTHRLLIARPDPFLFLHTFLMGETILETPNGRTWMGSEEASSICLGGGKFMSQDQLDRLYIYQLIFTLFCFCISCISEYDLILFLYQLYQLIFTLFCFCITCISWYSPYLVSGSVVSVNITLSCTPSSCVSNISVTPDSESRGFFHCCPIFLGRAPRSGAWFVLVDLDMGLIWDNMGLIWDNMGLTWFYVIMGVSSSENGATPMTLEGFWRGKYH